jgi:hypothetical protein
MFRACTQSGRHLVLDLYAASIAARTGQPKHPEFGLRKAHSCTCNVIQAKESREFDREAGIKAVRIFPEELAGEPLTDRARDASESVDATISAHQSVRCGGRRGMLKTC